MSCDSLNHVGILQAQSNQRKMEQKIKGSQNHTLQNIFYFLFHFKDWTARAYPVVNHFTRGITIIDKDLMGESKVKTLLFAKQTVRYMQRYRNLQPSTWDRQLINVSSEGHNSLMVHLPMSKCTMNYVIKIACQDHNERFLRDFVRRSFIG